MLIVVVYGLAGYSRLIGLDDAGTLERLVRYAESDRSGIEEHGGRIVKTGGDSLLSCSTALTGRFGAP